MERHIIDAEGYLVDIEEDAPGNLALELSLGRILRAEGVKTVLGADELASFVVGALQRLGSPPVDRLRAGPRLSIGPAVSTSGLYLDRLYLRRDPDVVLHAFHSHDTLPHDHPWDFESMVLSGGYTECLYSSDGTPAERVERRVGDIVQHKAEDTHRIAEIEKKPTHTLVVCGPRQRDWTYLYGGRRRHWRGLSGVLKWA